MKLLTMGLLCVIFASATNVARSGSVSAQTPTATPDALPDCTADPAACQEMLAQYAELYGPLPSPTPAPEIQQLPAIEMTEGVEPPEEVQATIDGYVEELRVFTEYVCTNEEVQNGVWYSINQEGKSSEEVFSRYEGLDQESLDFYEVLGFRAWSVVAAELTDYLGEQAAAGNSVPSRAPTLLELAEQYPGCSTGEYIEW